MTNKKFRQLFYRLNHLAIKTKNIGDDFHDGLEERYNSTYSDNDIDQIIDCLDYGLGRMTFPKFKKLMKPFKTK